MNKDTVLIIGLVLIVILVMLCYLKFLRNNIILFTLLVITCPIAVFHKMLNVDTSLIFIGPFIYLSSYGLLKQLYKGMYRREPTYSYGSSYDYEENRKLSIMDYIVFVIPMVAAGIIPILLMRN